MMLCMVVTHQEDQDRQWFCKAFVRDCCRACIFVYLTGTSPQGGRMGRKGTFKTVRTLRHSVDMQMRPQVSNPNKL
eukprot:6464272-Amphidinium_carterae.1